MRRRTGVMKKFAGQAEKCALKCFGHGKNGGGPVGED